MKVLKQHRLALVPTYPATPYPASVVRPLSSSETTFDFSEELQPMRMEGFEFVSREMPRLTALEMLL